MQRLTKKQNIYGLGIGFESLTSKVRIDSAVQEWDIYLFFPFSAETQLKNTFITLHPFVGHKITKGRLAFTITGGLDISFCLKSQETGKNTSKLLVENDKAKPAIDFRPRLQLKTEYKRFGFLTGYSLGITNYSPGETLYHYPNNLKAFSNFLRLGLSYKIK